MKLKKYNNIIKPIYRIRITLKHYLHSQGNSSPYFGPQTPNDKPLRTPGAATNFHLFFTLNSAYPIPFSLRYANEEFLLCNGSSFIIIISQIRIKIRVRQEKLILWNKLNSVGVYIVNLSGFI